jgi:hypothetical protein
MRPKSIFLVFVIFLTLSVSANAAWFMPISPPPSGTGSAGGNVSGIISTSPYLYISSIAGIFNILLNETILNATIDDRALGGSFVPYTGAIGDIDLNNKSITNINIINATTGYFSNHTVYIGDTKLSSNASNELSIGDGAGDVYGRFYYGSAKYLTDINLSSINGTVIFNGPLNMNGYNIFNVSNITAGNICYSNGTGCIAIANGTDGQDGQDGTNGINGLNGTNGINGTDINSTNFYNKTETDDTYVPYIGAIKDINLNNRSIENIFNMNISNNLYVYNITYAHGFGGLSPIRFVDENGTQLMQLNTSNSTSGWFGHIRAHSIEVDVLDIYGGLSLNGSATIPTLSDVAYTNTSNEFGYNQIFNTSITLGGVTITNWSNTTGNFVPYIGANSNVDLGVYNITTTGRMSFYDADWTGGNIVYVPINGNISAYLNSAAAGDTLVLADGTYTIATQIFVNKAIRIVGQGLSTIIYSTVGNSFQVNSDDVIISDLFISNKAQGSSCILVGNNFNNINIENILCESIGIGTKYGINGAGGSLNIKNSKIIVNSTNDYAFGFGAMNLGSTTQNIITNISNVEVYTQGRTGSEAFYFDNQNSAYIITANIFYSIGIGGAASGITDNGLDVSSATTNTITVNSYYSTFGGADDDIRVTNPNIVNLYSTTLVSGTTNKITGGIINVIGNLFSSYFIGNGSFLTNVCLSNGTNCAAVSNINITMNGSNSDMWANTTNYLYINETKPQAINTTKTCLSSNCSSYQIITKDNDGVNLTWY